MNNFFDTSLFQQIFSGLVVLLVSIWLGSSSLPKTTGKGWKIAVIIGWVMIWGGLYIFSSHIGQGGFNNPLTGLGLCLFILGIPLVLLGRFFVWWHH